MDSEKLAKRYIDKYHTLTSSEKKGEIGKLIDELNMAIENSDMQLANNSYIKILDWNFEISGLETERNSLNEHFKNLNLPSIMMFSVIYDQDEKKWRFNS